MTTTALIAPSASLFVKVGRAKYPFQGAAHASQAYRDTIEELDLGASQTPPCYIIDGKGTKVGHISYNGKVWAGAEWQSGDEPVYNPYALGDA
jgi:hypothetical protein